MYHYKATLIKVIDGDTIDAEVDLGFSVFLRERFRLADINAPEVRGKEKEAGKKAKAALQDLLDISEGKIEIHSTKALSKGKYGRWIAQIFAWTVDGEEYSVNTEMVSRNFAVYKKY